MTLALGPGDERLAVEARPRRSPAARATVPTRRTRREAGRAGEPHGEPLLAGGAGRQRPDRLERPRLARGDRDDVPRVGSKTGTSPRRAAPWGATTYARTRTCCGAVREHARAVRDGVERAASPGCAGRWAGSRGAPRARREGRPPGSTATPSVPAVRGPKLLLADAERDPRAGRAAHARVPLAEAAGSRASRRAGRRAVRRERGDDRDLRDSAPAGTRNGQRTRPPAAGAAPRCGPRSSVSDELLDLGRRRDRRARRPPSWPSTRRGGSTAIRQRAAGGGRQRLGVRRGHRAQRARGRRPRARGPRRAARRAQRPPLMASRASHSTRSRRTRLRSPPARQRCPLGVRDPAGPRAPRLADRQRSPRSSSRRDATRARTPAGTTSLERPLFPRQRSFSPAETSRGDGWSVAPVPAASNGSAGSSATAVAGSATPVSRAAPTTIPASAAPAAKPAMTSFEVTAYLRAARRGRRCRTR